MDLFSVLVGVLAAVAGVLYLYLRRRHGKLEHLGIPIVPPFLCFGSPPFSYHKSITHEYYVQVKSMASQRCLPLPRLITFFFTYCCDVIYRCIKYRPAMYDLF